MTDALVEPSSPPTAPSPPPAPQSWGEPIFAPERSGSSQVAPPGIEGRGGTAPAARLYLTSDLRAATGLSRTHMDFYLREGLVRPSARTEGGYLLFDEAELATLRAVLRWRHEGLGLKQIRERLGR